MKTHAEAAEAALALKQRMSHVVHTQEHKQGYYNGVNDLLERLYPTCRECGRPYDEDADGS